MKREGWNEYYESTDKPWTKADVDIKDQASRLTPGRALDLGSGEGANSLWLAERGWDVTAVDYSQTAIATMERLASKRNLSIKGVVADIRQYRPNEEYDLVFVCFVHLHAPERAKMLSNAAAALSPRGTLLYVGIVRPIRPFEDGIPSDLLAIPQEIITELPGLTIEKVNVQSRPLGCGCPHGDLETDVMVVSARRPKDA